MASPPGAPSQTIALAGSDFAVVEWAAPADDGGAAITSYAVTPNSGSAVTVSGSPPPTIAVITDLQPGASYTFTVSATNSAGPGSASAATAAVVPGGALVIPARYVITEDAVALGIDPATAQAEYADATALYEQIKQAPLVSFETLVTWAMREWQLTTRPTDRVQAALNMLAGSKYVVALVGS